MPGKRKITGVKPLFGQSRSKAYNTVKRQFKPNLQNKRIYVPGTRSLGPRQNHRQGNQDHRQDRLHGVPQAPQYPLEAASLEAPANKMKDL